MVLVVLEILAVLQEFTLQMGVAVAYISFPAFAAPPKLRRGAGWLHAEHMAKQGVALYLGLPLIESLICRTNGASQMLSF